MSRNRKLIKSIGTVALTGVVATTALTGLTSCGKTKVSKEESIVISLADEEATSGEECLSSSWLPLSEKSDNATFRENFNTLTHNRTSNQKKEGTIYYLENPTLATSLKNTAFTTLFDSLDTTTLLSLTQDLYLDLDETTSPDILKAAVINTYFDLFNTKQSQSQNEFNATQRISRVDFISAVVKSTTSPQSNESSLSENDIMSKLADKSYLGNNNTNNTETGIITKAEAAYMIASCMFNNEMSEQKASKPAENLQSCLESSELSSDLKEAMSILESKGVIDESFVGNWNKALTKSEAVDMIYKGLKVAGLASSDAVNEDVIAEEEAAKAAAEAARALEEARENAIEEVNGFSNLTDSGKSPFIARIQSANSTDEIDGILTEANEENDKYAQAVAATRRARIIGSSTPKVSGGGADTPSSNPNRGSKGEVVDTGEQNGNTVDWDKEVDGPEWR